MPGEEFFAPLRKRGIYYVDKTEYLKPLLCGSGRALLLQRPALFGKTLMLSTLRCFLEMDYEDPGDTARQQELFRGLRVMEDREFCNEHMGQHPVLSVCLRSIDGISFEDAYGSLASDISDLAHDFRWLDGPKLTEEEHEFLKRLLDFEYLRHQGSKGCLIRAFSFLSRLLLERFGESHSPVLIIDDCCAPLRNAAEIGFYEPMSELIGAMLSDALSPESGILKVILAGYLRCPDESFCQELSKMCADTVLSESGSLSEAIGFTPDEAKAMFECYGFGNLFETARRHFGFYSIGGHELFCPEDIGGFLNGLYDSDDPARHWPEPYWVRQGGYNIITSYMPHLGPDGSDRLEELASGGSISAEADDRVSFAGFRGNKWTPAEFRTVLLHAGYLTAVKREAQNTFEIRVPNDEILEYFRHNISSYYEDRYSDEYGKLAESFIDGIRSGDSVNAGRALRVLLRGFVSLNEPRVRASSESYYKEFFNTVFSAVRRNIWDFRFENGSGSGYITYSTDGCSVDAALVLRYAEDNAVPLSDPAGRALEQIDEKEYARLLSRAEASRKVLVCGIALRGRDCAVVLRELHP